MKTRLLIIIGFTLVLGFACTAFGQYIGDKIPPNTTMDPETGKDVFPPSYVDFYYSNPEFKKYSIIAGHYRYDVPYMITNGTISKMEIDCSNIELILILNTSGNQGWITLALPRQLIDSKTSSQKDDGFVVLVNSNEVRHSDISSEKLRLLIIPISNDTSQVNIIGINYPESVGTNACNGKNVAPFSYLLSPLKQIKSGISLDEIQCRDSLVLVTKINGSPACVKPEIISELIGRGWTTQTLVQDIVMKTMSKKLDPQCSQNTMDGIMNGDVDERCAKFMDGLVTKRQSEMMQQGYAFDQESKSWTKKGYPDMLMNIVDYYQQNLKNSKPTHESEPKPLDIASIEDRYIHLNPADMCAIISLELMSPDETEQRKSSTKNVVFLEFDDKDIEGMPILDELIRATHHLEFPSNEYSDAEMGLRELVDYEFFIMDKAIEKYNDTQNDYFMKLDADLDERLADPKKQGFSNEFIAPQIVYHDKAYVLSHTVFWVSDEHEMQSMSVHLKNLDEAKKFVILNDEDMESIPKIREAIDKIGTELESVVAFKGVPENPDWKDYQEWYAKKGMEQFGTDDVQIRGFVYENEHYELSFPIC